MHAGVKGWSVGLPLSKCRIKGHNTQSLPEEELMARAASWRGGAGVAARARGRMMNWRSIFRMSWVCDPGGCVCWLVDGCVG